MKPSAGKNQKLIKQYPFITDVMSVGMEPLDGLDSVDVNDLNIRIEKADGDLMFRQADNVGLGDTGCIFYTKGPRKGQIARKGEYCFAVNSDNRIINQVSWPRNNTERIVLGYKTHGYAVLWSNRVGESYSSPIFNEVEYIVWVTVESHYKDNNTEDLAVSRCGEFVDRSLNITIYSKPDCGFDKLNQTSCLEENLCISSDLLITAMHEKDYRIIAIGGRIDELCRLFQDEVYFNGMKDIFDKGKSRGASGQFGLIQVLCAEMCGYDRVMLKDSNSWISFQLSSESKSMYALGMWGTLPQLRNLTKSIVKIWNEDFKNRSLFKEDSEVSVI